MNFEKFLRTPFLQNTSGRLLLHVADEEAAVDSCQADKTAFEKTKFHITESQNPG